MNGKRIVCGVKLIRKDKDLSAVMHLTENEEGYSISFSEDSVPELVASVEVIIRQLKEGKEYRDKLVFWKDLLLAIESEQMTYNELSNNDLHLALNLDIAKENKLVSYSNNKTDGNVPDEISRSIANIISKVFTEYGVDKVDEVENALSRKDIYSAYKLLEKALEEGIIQLGSKNTNTRLFHLVCQIPISSLTTDEQKKLYEYKFILGEKTGLFSELYDDVSHYIDEFGDQADSKLATNLLLLKANAAAQQEKKELAYSLYQQVLKKSTDDFGTAAWAHRGLAILFGYEDSDALYHEKMAADAFLLSGNKFEYITSKVALAENTKTSDPNQAIKLLEEAINVLDVNNPTHKDRIASLMLNKAMIYNFCGQNELALKEAQNSIILRDGNASFGNESKTIASLNAAMFFEEAVAASKNKKNLESKYESRIHDLEKVMLDDEKPSYKLRKKISIALANKDWVELELVRKEVLAQNDSEIIISYWIALVITKPNTDLHIKIELMENAWAEVFKSNVSNDMKFIVCSLFAEIYKDNEMDEKALEWYDRALSFNPFSWPSRQNYVTLLWKNHRWKEAVIFFEEQKKRFGDLPSILFAYGKSLVESGEPGKAIPILRLAQKKNPEAEYIHEYLEKALDQLGEVDQITPLTLGASNTTDNITISMLEQCLHDFIQFIQSDKRMTFWKYDTSEKKHKWVSSPEQHGQNLLHTFIKSRFGDNINAIEEVSAGAGRIDIYLWFQNGIKTVVELKICGGSGYSQGYALEGVKQLSHYLDNRQTYLGYLIVFDGRIRDYGKGIEPQYSYEKFTIRSYVADVRPEVK